EGVGGTPSVAIQGDGRVVVVGTGIGPSGAYDIAVARYNTDGSLDGSFGSGGIVNQELAPGSGVFGTRVAVQPDGRIVVVGPRQEPSRGVYDIAVARLNSDGSLDNNPTTGFGADHGGWILTDLGGYDVPTALLLQPSGKILVGGFSGNVSPGNNGNFQFALVRYNPNGTLDPT